MKANEFNYSDPQEPVEYMHENPDITNVVFSGGDPLTMSTKDIRKFIEPFLSVDTVHSICFTTKALGWWPYRFTSENDSAELLGYFEEIRSKKKHVSLIAHFSHPKELTTRAVRDAITVLKQANVVIRCQNPLLSGINDSPEILAELWQRQVDLGLVPYYLFLESDSESRQYYKIPFDKAFGIFKEAQKKVSSLSKTVQGPVIMHNAGKILMQGILRFAGKPMFLFKHIEHPDPEMVGEQFLAESDSEITHVHQLKPVCIPSLSLSAEFEPSLV